MKALIMGCGSIGMRRAEILYRQGHELWFMDNDIHRSVGAARSFHGHATEWIPDDMDAVLICTPPDSGRCDQIHDAIVAGATGIYVEKPLAITAGEVYDISDILDMAEGRVTMGACNLRFVNRIEELRRIRRPWNILTLTMRQHKKFWNPEHKSISLILDSIHELDLAVSLNGAVESIRGWSTLDACEASVHHENGGLSHIFLDRRGDPPSRHAHVVTPKDNIRMVLVTDNSMYEREMQHFMDAVAARRPTCNPLVHACAVNIAAMKIA